MLPTDGEGGVRGDSLTHHWSLRMSRHIAPVTELILGCQIFVINRTWGEIHNHRMEKSNLEEREEHFCQLCETVSNAYLWRVEWIRLWNFNF